MKIPPNILVLTYWSLPDALIQTYTLPYLRIIRKRLPKESQIFLLTLEKKRNAQTEHTVKLALRKEGIEWLPEQYHPFGIIAMMIWLRVIIRLLIHIRRNNIQYIHCWATPAGAIGYVLSLISGAKLIVDSYEPHAEAMVENGTWKAGSFPFRFLFALEKMQTRRAKHLIAANAGMLDYSREKYGVQPGSFFVKPACVDMELFQPRAVKENELLLDLQLEGKIVGVYTGKLGGIYLDHEVFAFLREAHLFWGDRFRALLLTNHLEEEISSFCSQANLPRSITIVRFVPHAEVPRYLAIADFGITPVKPVPTKRYCTPIKDGEYWAMGLPVVITAGISDDSEIVRTEKIGAVLDRLDPEGYRQALIEIDNLLNQPRSELVQRIRAIASRYRNYSIAEKIYDDIYGP